MSQDGLLWRKFLAWRPGRPSLTVRLAAAAVCLLAAGAAIIVVAGGLVTRDDLMRQGGQQLRGYAGQLARHPFLLTPLSRTPPGAPGLSDLAAAGAGALSIQVRSASGQLIMRVGPGRRAQARGPLAAGSRGRALRLRRADRLPDLRRVPGVLPHRRRPRCVLGSARTMEARRARQHVRSGSDRASARTRDRLVSAEAAVAGSS